MNGLIPELKTRSYGRSFANSIAGGVCLFLGFIVGTQVPSSSAVESQTQPATKNPFSETTIDFSKIAWVTNEFAGKSLKLAENLADSENSEVNVTLTFSSFELPKKFGQKKYLVRKSSPKKRSNLNALATVVAEIQKPKVEIVEEPLDDTKLDYQMAMESLRSRFYAAVLLPSMPVSVAQVEEQTEERAAKTAEVKKSIIRQRGPIKKSIVRKLNKRVPLAPAPVKPVEMDAEVTDVQFPKPEPVVVVPGVNTQEKMSIQTAQSSADVNINAPEPTAEVQKPIQAVPEPNEGSLSSEEKELLKNGLLSEQLKNSLAAKPPQKVLARVHVPQPRPSVAPEPTPTPAPIDPNSCEVLANHKFFKPGAEQDTQICPTQKTWISKENIGIATESGWVKLEVDNSFPVLTRHPAANGGSTLLLDSNSVALIAIRAGVRVAKGAGILVGVIPEGYKVEFLGRGEEAETFELGGKKYFAFLNAEPGAGVIEVTSEKDQNVTSTVFAPVLQDVITYLDLAKPEQKNIFVQVTKSGKPSDPEISGLTVGVSTYRGIQAITQSTGQAALRNVNIVPGFPVFVDVSSKNGTEQGFTYRYELKYKNSNGIYLLNQVTDKNVYKWIKQIPSGISDQSAMILGSVNPRLLNGFKNYYYPRVYPLSEKFGLEPLNFSILWDGQISSSEPIEGDKPRFMAIQVPEGIAQVKLMNEHNQEIYSSLIPVSPRVINVISE